MAAFLGLSSRRDRLRPGLCPGPAGASGPRPATLIENGYSARNFLSAIGPDGVLWTVDINAVPRLAPNHVTLQRDCVTLRSADFDGQAVDLVFFHCHVYDAQMSMYGNLVRDGAITDRTVIALHDTNLHPIKLVPQAFKVEGGWVHQDVERRMVNTFRNEGYEALMLHTTADRHDPSLPVRHGLTILTRNHHLPHRGIHRHVRTVLSIVDGRGRSPGPQNA